MPDYSGFIQLLEMLGRTGDTLRLGRANAVDQFKAVPVTYEQIPAALDVLNNHAFNVWFEINPSNFDRPAGRSKAGDITRLTALYADLDFKEKPHGMSSLPEALEVVQSLSAIIGFQPSAIVQTGGGIHPYWPILDGEIDDDNRADSIRRLKRWGELVKQTAKAAGGDADSVYDLPRILRVPGTFNLKNADVPRGTSITFTGGIGKIDIAWIDEVLDEYQITVDMVDVDNGIVSASADWDWAHESCQFVATAAREIAESVPTSRHHWALKWSAILHGMVRNGCITEADFYLLRQVFMDRFAELLKIQGTPRLANREEIPEILRFGKLKAEGWSKTKLNEELRGHEHFDFADSMVAPVTLPPSTSESVAGLAPVSSIFSGTVIPMDAIYSQPVTAGNLALSVDLRSQERLARAMFTDTGNAENLSLLLRGRFVYAPGLGWHVWDTNRWAPDAAGALAEAAKDGFIHLHQTAPDDAARKWMHSSLSSGRIKAALDLAKTIPFMVVEPIMFDAQPYELNTPDGIVDLRTSEIRAADPHTDFHTLRTAQAPRQMEIPRFMAFLEFALGDASTSAGPVSVDGLFQEPITTMDRTRISYVQRLFGAAAIGKLLHHVFPIFLGVGANGKTTLLDIIAGVLGQYATVLPAKFLVERRGEVHPTEIAQLRGIRMAISSEVPPNARFDESLVKMITGETRLKARYIGQDFIEFENTVTPFLGANHLPSVTVGGSGFWRRIRKVDFEKQVPIELQNPNLVRDVLREEGPGVLQWVIDGARDLLANGLQDPPKVMIATREYQLEEDTLARFIEAELEKAPGTEVQRDQVFTRYQDWVHRQQLPALSQVKFSREIATILPYTALGARDVFSNLRMRKTAWQEFMEDIPGAER